MAHADSHLTLSILGRGYGSSTQIATMSGRSWTVAFPLYSQLMGAILFIKQRGKDIQLFSASVCSGEFR